MGDHGACVPASAFAWWRRGNALTRVLKVHARLAAYPVLAVLGFVVFSKITVGEWFVSSGFFVPDETLRGQPMAVYEKVAEGIHLLGGAWLFRFAQVAVRWSARWDSPPPAGRRCWLTLFGAGAAGVGVSPPPVHMRYEIPSGGRRDWSGSACSASSLIVDSPSSCSNRGHSIEGADDCRLQLDRNVHAREQVWPACGSGIAAAPS